IILHILLNSKSQTSSKFLDEIYSGESISSLDVDEYISKFGNDALYTHFCFVYDELTKVIAEFSSSYHTYIFKNEPVKVQNSYQVLFIAFNTLLINENKKVQNYKELAKLLRGIATDCMGALNGRYKWLA
ncbi:hypothetical protein R0K30_21125, partial [Bacillus sp. SIMBA_154]|uniref:hypothetical protein n=1 Tax=Bacillus sp. SIMBA_154 TaxID=3080859 RepID=UPI00397C30A2